jgi:hypothetical protein
MNFNDQPIQERQQISAHLPAVKKFDPRLQHSLSGWRAMLLK